MKSKDLKVLGTEELIAHFREVSAKHGRLLNARDTRAANKNYRLAAAVRKDLRTRGPDAEKRLLALLTDPEPGTRYWAATAALGFAPSEAERALALLAEPPPTMLSVSAAMTLRAWKDGTLPPEE
ncbi:MULTISPECIES: DUF2019 domain-containing protein [unclassified Corallococcus]|uniref:DUF2019 domain-containing protein n=1 Tax=unclassified Corallococcus TaxID=2685029 RepID=UPI001A8FDB4D|nr:MULTISPECIES: DUF2019 domain-containing protein [unclassified Corallococcus]MBN9688418.1 DUF2019 domain-containing protein [Corallococcus sp. NCSPR001]WAS87783.1 DUF2019 domain-containing protein [Corallococcus sp. NCRR]